MSFRSAGVIPAKLICSLKGAGLARVIGASAALANCCSAACAAGLTFDFSATFSITLGSILASFSAVSLLYVKNNNTVQKLLQTLFLTNNCEYAKTG